MSMPRLSSVRAVAKCPPPAITISPEIGQASLLSSATAAAT